jgi:hypothetical protein
MMSLRKNGRVSLDIFRRYFGSDLEGEFAGPLKVLLAQGAARLEEGSLVPVPGGKEGRFRCAAHFLEPGVLQRALWVDQAAAVPFLRLSSAVYAAEFSVEHARHDETYLRVRGGLGLRLVYAGEQCNQGLRSRVGRQMLLDLAQRAFQRAVRRATPRQPSVVMAEVFRGIRARAERLGLECRQEGPGSDHSRPAGGTSDH